MIVLLPCNIFKGRSVSVGVSMKKSVVGLVSVNHGSSSATVGFHDVSGAVGLVSELVVCADAADAVCASVLLVLAVSCR